MIQFTEASLNTTTSNLPELTGTPKQVKWATEIRENMISGLAAWDDILKDDLSEVEFKALWHKKIFEEKVMPGVWYRTLYWDVVSCIKFAERFSCLSSKKLQASHSEKVTMLRLFLSALKKQERAGWWIEHRDVSMEKVLYDLREEFLHVPQPPVTSEQQQAIDEMTIRPKNPVTNQPATVAIGSHEIKTSIKKFIPEFRQAILRVSRFNSDLNAWIIKPLDSTDDLRHRAAEQINSLLKAGIPVLCSDDEIRQMAVSATFQPSYPRWIIDGGNGFLIISFPRNDREIIDELNKIKQVIVRNNRYLIQSRYWDIVRHLQYELLFRLESSVDKLITNRQCKHERQIVEPRNAPAAQLDKRDITPTGEVDPELLDD